MALKISLKPHEKMILGGAVITNGNSMGCHLVIENKVPILREKDILLFMECLQLKLEASMLTSNAISFGHA